MKGDTAYLRVTVPEFESVPAQGKPADGKSLCAPAGSRAFISEETADRVYVNFDAVTNADDFILLPLHKASLKACAAGSRVSLGTQYSISKASLAKYDFGRTGISFGALVIPFKYRLGEDKELLSSPAVAPYVGFRTSWLQSFGLTFTPVMAAGLSLVPVPTADGKETENKAAYTVALGWRISSSKNEKFSAGLLYGRDFLGRRDTDATPKLKRPWLSFYLGASL